MNPQSRKLSVMFSTGLLLVLADPAARVPPHWPPIPRQPQPAIARDRRGERLHAHQSANAAVTLTELRGKVWIADIIFTRCTGPCLKMTRQMKELQDALPATTYQARHAYNRPGFRHAASVGEVCRAFRCGHQPLDVPDRNQKGTWHIGWRQFETFTVEIKPDDANQKTTCSFTARFLSWWTTGAAARVFETGGEGVNWQTEKQRILAAVKQLNANHDFHRPSHRQRQPERFERHPPHDGYIFIRRGNKIAHRNCMVSALITSSAFLACYSTTTFDAAGLWRRAHRFLNPAWFRPIYLTLLFTHLIGAFLIVPLVLMTVSRAIKQRFDLHKKIARWTWPIWITCP